LSSQNENPDEYDNNNNPSNEAKERSKITEVVEELQKEQRESEQLDVNPDQVLEEKEKRQPQSVEEEE
jgi:hypothetical protein